MSLKTYTIDIPKLFATDHSERDLPTGRRVKTLSRTIRFECTAPELREWLSDATYYSDCAGEGWDFGNQLAMQASARGTALRVVRLMEAQGIPKDGPIAD